MNTGLTVLHLVKAFVTLLPCFKMFAATKTAGFCRTRNPPGGQKVPFPGQQPLFMQKSPAKSNQRDSFLYFHDTIIAHLNVALCSIFTIN